MIRNLWSWRNPGWDLCFKVFMYFLKTRSWDKRFKKRFVWTEWMPTVNQIQNRTSYQTWTPSGLGRQSTVWPPETLRLVLMTRDRPILDFSWRANTLSNRFAGFNFISRLIFRNFINIWSVFTAEFFVSVHVSELIYQWNQRKAPSLSAVCVFVYLSKRNDYLINEWTDRLIKKMSRNPDRKSCTDPAGLPGANFLLYFRIKGSKIAVWFLLRLLKVETFQLNGFREQLLDADPDAFPFHGF